MQPAPSATLFLRRLIMKYKGVEYTVVSDGGRTGWRWEVTFGAGKNKFRRDAVSSSGGAIKAR